jgi:hypothetical protein
MGTRERKKSKGKGGNAAAQQHRQMPLSPVSDAGQSVDSPDLKSKIASDETVKSTESPERHHGKEQPFSEFDIAAIGLTAIGSASTAVGLYDAGESLWSTGVVSTGSAWCAFLASFFSTRQGFAEVHTRLDQGFAEVRENKLEVRANNEKSQLQEEIKILESETYRNTEGARERIEIAKKRIDDINEELFPRAAKIGYEEIPGVFLV